MSGDLIGSRISLISRKDIRWEGILVQVDRENASVTLQSVKSWGTEGRAEEGMHIPPAEQLHEMVQFRGEDIKDLHVHETAEPAPVPPPPPPPPPAAATAPAEAAAVARATAAAAAPAPSPVYAPAPAPPSTPTPAPAAAVRATVAAPAASPARQAASPAMQAASPRQPAFVAPDAAAGGGAEEVSAGAKGPPTSGVDVETQEEGEGSKGTSETAHRQMMRDQGQRPGRYQPPHKNPNWKPPPTVHRVAPSSGSGSSSSTGAAALPGQGNHLLNRRTRGAGSGPLEEEGDFDFEAGLAKFDKEKEMAILAEGMSATSIYDGRSRGPSSMMTSSSPGLSNGGGARGAGAAASASGELSGEGTRRREEEQEEAAAGDMGGGGAAAAAAAAAESAEHSLGMAAGGECRSAADGGEIWVEPPVVVKKYNKSSFFDEISCDALDGRGRMPGGRHEERTRNTETFGATSVALSSSSRRYGGRGGGGYNNGYSGGGRSRGGGYSGGDSAYRGRSYNGDRGAGVGGGGGGGGGGGFGTGGDGGSNRHDSSGNWRRT